MNLTKRQKEILDFIRSYRNEHGISPTQREIRETFRLSSFGTVQKHLKRLEEKGALAREWNRSRGIAPKEDSTGARGVPLLGLVAAGRPIEPFPHEESIERSSSSHRTISPAPMPVFRRPSLFQSMATTGLTGGKSVLLFRAWL